MERPEGKRRRSQKVKRISFAMSVGLSVLMVLLYGLSRPEISVLPVPEILDIIEAKTLDMRFRWRGVRQPGDRVVIVGVDEKAEGELGRWQTSGRRWLAECVDILHEAGAAVIGFDVVFVEPGNTAALTVATELKRRYVESLEDDPASHAEMLAYFEEARKTHDYDRQLADAIKRAGNVVLGIYHFFDSETAQYLTPEDLREFSAMMKRVKYALIRYPQGVPREPLRVRHSFGGEVNLPMFSDAANSFGHFNFIPDTDGFLRKANLLVEYDGQYYPSLSLEIVRTYLNPPLPPIIHALGREVGGNVASIQLGEMHIPTDEEGRLLLNFYGPGKTFPHYPLSEVVLRKDTISPALFKDKIVLLGFTAAIYQDLHSTSFQVENYPGVETHATLIENILQQDYVTRPEFAILFDIALLLALGILLGFFLQRTHPVTGIWTGMFALAGVFGIGYIAFVSWKIWLNVTYPVLFIFLDYVCITSYKYFAEEKRKREVRQAFQHYVSPAVVDKILNPFDALHLGGKRKVLTALFSDIRGFTSISEKMTPEELVHFLNEYLTAMTHIVLEYEGTVDKYMGDAIMAFYGAPLDQPDHAVRACNSAIDMMSRLHVLRTEWANRDLPYMNIGIGINSGEMSVGNMGSEERFDYTIMGDNVNLASRLEGINKQYGTNIVISEFTYRLIRNESFIVRELDSVRVKGKQEPVTIYELIGQGTPDPQLESLLSAFHDGLEAYKHQEWDRAIALFQEVLRIHIHSDDKPAKLYIQRCEEYKRTAPPEDWDGVFVMKTK